MGLLSSVLSIGGAANAGILAARILGTTDSALAAKLDDYAKGLEALVAEKNDRLQDTL